MKNMRLIFTIMMMLGCATGLDAMTEDAGDTKNPIAATEADAMQVDQDFGGTAETLPENHEDTKSEVGTFYAQTETDYNDLINELVKCYTHDAHAENMNSKLKSLTACASNVNFFVDCYEKMPEEYKIDFATHVLEACLQSGIGGPVVALALERGAKQEIYIAYIRQEAAQRKAARSSTVAPEITVEQKKSDTTSNALENKEITQEKVRCELMHGVKESRPEKVTWALEHGASPNELFYEGMWQDESKPSDEYTDDEAKGFHILDKAIALGDENIIVALIRAGAYVDDRWSDSDHVQKLIRYYTSRGDKKRPASAGGNEDIGAMLVAARQDIFELVYKTISPEYRKAFATHILGKCLDLDLRGPVAVLALERGAHPNGFYDDEQHATTLLGLAAFNGDQSLVKLLLENGATEEDTPASNSLHKAVMSEDPAIMELVTQVRGVHINNFSQYNRTPLFDATIENKIISMHWLLDHGADASIECGKDNITALHAAAERGNDRAASLLIRQGKAPANARDRHNRTPLFLACLGGHANVVETIFDEAKEAKEIDVNAYCGLLDGEQAPDGVTWFCEEGTAVHAAVIGGNLEVLKLLKKHGLKLGLRMKVTKRTALFIAAENGSRDLVEWLVNPLHIQHVRIDAVCGEEPWTALQIAAVGGHFEIVKLLVDAGAKTGIQDKAGLTALRLAQEAFAGAKIDIEIQNKEGLTALQLAQKELENQGCLENFEKIISFLSRNVSND